MTNQKVSKQTVRLYRKPTVSLILVCMLGIFSTTSHADTVRTLSAYTSIQDTDCATVSAPENGGMYHKRCASYAGYDVDVVGADTRYGLDIKWGNTSVTKFPAMPFHVGKMVEWRYRVPINNNRMKDNTPPSFHALIYRLYTARADVINESLEFLPREQDKQELIVVRLAKENSCIIGIIPQSSIMNEQARQRADDMTAPCINVGNGQ